MKFDVKFCGYVIIIGCVIALALSLHAAPHFVTPAMTYRNGLTDEQYEMLWSQGKHPRIGQREARDWIFRGSRFSNVTNWLEVIGRTNDFAKLVYPTMTTNEILRADNQRLEIAVDALDRHVTTLTNEVRIISDKLEEAKQDAKAADEIRKAAKRTEKNLAKVIKELEKAKKKAADEAEEALWNSLIAILEGRDPNAENGGGNNRANDGE